MVGYQKTAAQKALPDPVRLGVGRLAAGAVGVFVLGHALSIGLWGHSSLSRNLQLLTCLVAYLLVTLAIFRFLESREAAVEEGDLLGDESDRETVFGVSDAMPHPLKDAEKEVLAGFTPTSWSIDLLHQLEWKRTVDLCLAYFDDRFRCEASQLGEEGGVDLRLFRPNEETPAGIIYCRAWGGREVELEVLESLSLKMAQGLIPKGFCIGFGGFSESARSFAEGHGITLIDGAMFVTMVKRLPEERKQKLLALACEGDFSTPSCPVCGLKMIACQQEQTRYWGCRAYPRCKGLLPLRPPLHKH